MSGRYGKGCRPDPAHRRTQKSSRVLLGAASSLPKSFSAEHLEGEILDQSTTSGCGGHGTAQAVYVASQAQGMPLPFFPSPKGIYENIRAVERAATYPQGYAGELAPLTDSGIIPADIAEAIGTWGVRMMHPPSPLGFQSDVDSSNATDEPSLADLEAEGYALIVGEYRVDEAAADAFDQLCAGLVKCGAVGIGVFVDTAFENYNPSLGPLDAPGLNLDDPNGGGHWLAVTSFYTRDDGVRVFRGPNSWGPGWGDRGHYEVTEHWLRKSRSDIYVFHMVNQ